MKPSTKKPQADRKSVLTRQLIASGIAIGIMALGVWSLLGRNAPYHPEVYTDDVTRSDTSALVGETDSD